MARRKRQRDLQPPAPPPAPQTDVVVVTGGTTIAAVAMGGPLKVDTSASGVTASLDVAVVIQDVMEKLRPPGE